MLTPATSAIRLVVRRFRPSSSRIFRQASRIALSVASARDWVGCLLRLEERDDIIILTVLWACRLQSVQHNGCTGESFIWPTHARSYQDASPQAAKCGLAKPVLP